MFYFHKWVNHFPLFDKSRFSIVLAFCVTLLHFASCFFCRVDHTQMYSSPISSLRLFQGIIWYNIIIYNIERLKGGPWNAELLVDLNWGGDLIWKGRPQTPLQTKTNHAPRMQLLDCSKLAINWKNDNDITNCWHDVIVNILLTLPCFFCQV